MARRVALKGIVERMHESTSPDLLKKRKNIYYYMKKITMKI
jgi:hypothetical protein